MRRTAIAAGLLIAITVAVAAVDVELEYVGDITALTGECFIRVLRLDSETIEGPDGEPVTAYIGSLELAGGEHAVQLTTEPEGPILRVDLDGSGELVRTEWDMVFVDGSFLANVPLTIVYEDGAQAPYQIFLKWSPFLPTAITFCRNSYREGEVTLGERTLRMGIVDADTDGRYDILAGGVLLIDTDGDGELLATGDSHEMFFLDDRFNVDGTTYEIAAVAVDGSAARIEESEEFAPPKPPLLSGFPAPAFSGSSPEGESILLAGFAGDVVVIDFWAGWCGPCIRELPTLRTLLEDFGDLGVSILGINMDRTLAEAQAAVEANAIDWPQVFDGADGPIGRLYRIEGIPMMYLVDAEGVIVTRGLRGQDLLDAVAELLGVTEESEDASDQTEPEG